MEASSGNSILFSELKQEHWNEVHRRARVHLELGSCDKNQMKIACLAFMEMLIENDLVVELDEIMPLVSWRH
jgi:hypothetical protein